MRDTPNHPHPDKLNKKNANHTFVKVTLWVVKSILHACTNCNTTISFAGIEFPVNSCGITEKCSLINAQEVSLSRNGTLRNSKRRQLGQSSY